MKQCQMKPTVLLYMPNQFLNNIVVPDQCISVIFCSVCLLYDYLLILTIIFFVRVLTNILEQQKDLFIEETTSKSTAKNLLHQLWKGRNTNTNHSLGAHHLYLFQSWCQIRRELLALPACIIPEFSGTCCL